MRGLPIRRYAWGLAFWSAVTVFFSTQRYFAEGGGAVGFLESLRRSAPQWYVWGLLSPFVFLTDRWARRTTVSLRGRLLWHVPLSLGFVSLYIVVRAFADDLLGNFERNWSFAALAPQYHWNLLIYAVIVGGLVAYDAHSEARARELEAAQLETKLARARLEALNAQLRPHFLFNTLNAISAFMEKDPKTARRMTAHLGDLLRQSLEQGDRHEIPLAEELSMIEDYLEIQKIRFEGRLSVKEDIAPETLRAAVPALILQPIVENAIEHGLVGKRAGGSIALEAARTDEGLRLTVADDGLGLAGQRESNGHGVGLSNTVERLTTLYGGASRLDVRSAEPAGVAVTLTLPWRPYA